MAEPSTIARPYAEAVFKLADEGGKLAEWSAALAMLAQVSENDRVQTAMDDPNQSAAQVAGLFSRSSRENFPATRRISFG